MDYYLLMEHWGTLIRDFKDEEKAYGIEPRDSEQLALKIVDFIRFTRIRQWTLFVQKRGEEYEQMVERLVDRGFKPEAIHRFVDQENRWTTTLEMGEH